MAQQPSGGSTQGKPSGQTQQQQPTQQPTQQQPSGQPSGSTDAEVDMDAWAARRHQMAVEQGYQGTDGSKRMDINDPNYADWVSGLVGELNGD